MTTEVSTGKKRVVVFISGGGSNMLALAKAAAESDFPAEIVAVIADKADAGGLAKAAALGGKKAEIMTAKPILGYRATHEPRLTGKAVPA